MVMLSRQVSRQVGRQVGSSRADLVHFVNLDQFPAVDDDFGVSEEEESSSSSSEGGSDDEEARGNEAFLDHC